MPHRPSSRSGSWTAAAFALLLPLFFLHAYPFPATLDSVSCAISVAEWRPGFLDGKPTYAFLGQVVREWNDLASGSRGDLMRRLSLWCALFGWGMVVNIYLLGRDLHGGRRSRGWAAAALLVSSPIFLFMAAVVEKYTVCLYLLTLAAVLWMRRRYASWGIVWGLALGAHITSVLFAVPCVVSLLRDPGRAGDRAKILRGCALAAAVAAPLYLWVLSHAQGAGAYLGYLRGIVFGEYGFMDALRPGRIVAAAAGSKAATALLALLVAGAVLALVAVGRKRGRLRQLSRAAALPAVAVGTAAAALVILWTYSKNIPLLLERAGYPLAAIGLVTAVASFAARRRRATTSAAVASPAISTFVLPWFVTNLLFFTAWDHFYGQFSLFIVTPLALLIAGLGIKSAETRTSGPADARLPDGLRGRSEGWAFALIVLAVVFGLWISRDIVEETRWKTTRENDELAIEEAAAIPPGSLVIAAWDGANLSFHAPSADVMMNISGRQSRAVVWKGKRPHGDPAGEVREALRGGRRAYVTGRWLAQNGDTVLAASREALEREFDLKPVARGLSELVPRGGAK